MFEDWDVIQKISRDKGNFLRKHNGDNRPVARVMRGRELELSDFITAHCESNAYQYIEIRTSPNMKKFALIPRMTSNNAFKITPNGGNKNSHNSRKICAMQLTKNYLADGGIYIGEFIDGSFIFDRKPVEIVETTRREKK